jgi:5'-nucleotidase/UDP-sugar diphosphatase
MHNQHLIHKSLTMRITSAGLALLVTLLCLLPTFASAQSEPVNLSILYTGDTHGHLRSFQFNSRKPVGGVAKRAIFFQEKRRHQKMVWLALDAGDAIAGTPLSNVFQGYLDIEAMNRLKYDAMVLGVHEFDYGVDVLRQRMAEAKFPMLAANVIDSSTGMPFASPYVILNRNGIRIAILGLTTGELAERVAPENFQGLTVKDPIETARDLIPQLQPQADVIIALTHLGVNEDIKLASQFQQIDVIVGGMSHSELQVPMRVVRTLIVHDAMYGYDVGQLKLSFERDGTELNRRYFDCSLVPMDGKWLENSDYLTWLDSFDEAFQQKMGRVVGSSAMRMTDTKIQSSETELGDFVCDVLRQRTGADGALLPAGFFQAGLPEGPLTLGDLYTALPYEHYADILVLTGSELQRGLDNGANQIGRSGFPQISGLSMGIFNGKAYNIRVNDQDLEPDREYRLATTDLVADGGAGYPALGDVERREHTGLRVRDLVQAQLAGGTSASAHLSARIQFLAQQPQVVAVEEEDERAREAAEPTRDEITDTTSEDVGRLDRTGEPMEDDSPAIIEDEVVSDQSAADAPVEEAAEAAAEAEPPARESSLPDFTQPRSRGKVMGTAKTSQDGLDYDFTLYRKDSGLYLLVLTVTNDGEEPVDLVFETNERFDFRVSSGSELRWNYNNNRFFVQSQQSEHVEPGSNNSLEFRADWDGTDNTGKKLPKQTYRFEAAFLLSGSNVSLQFEASLE